MLRLTINQLLPGMTTARNIYSANGTLLLAKDVTLDANLISKLGNLDINSVYIKHPYLEIEPQEILHEKTRVEIIQKTRKLMVSFRETGTVNLAEIHDTVKQIIEDAINNRHLLIHLTDIRTRDDYTFGHSINVCLLSVMIGIKICLKEHQLFELALGAILHDLGKTMIPLDILNKPAGFTPEEWKIMQDHASQGFEILRKQGVIPLPASHVAFQHHENYDGSGYPRGLSGESIHQYARVVAVADFFDAVSSDRPYRKAFLPHEAYELVLASRGSKLDSFIVDAFLENVALYPVGTSVVLDTGEIGVVINVYPKLQMRPILKIVVDKCGNPWSGTEKVVDLSQELTRFIVKVLLPEEVFKINGKEK